MAERQFAWCTLVRTAEAAPQLQRARPAACFGADANLRLAGGLQRRTGSASEAQPLINEPFALGEEMLEVSPPLRAARIILTIRTRLRLRYARERPQSGSPHLARRLQDRIYRRRSRKPVALETARVGRASSANSSRQAPAHASPETTIAMTIKPLSISLKIAKLSAELR